MIWPSSLIDPAIPLDKADRNRVRIGAWRRWMRVPANRVLYGGGLVAALVIFMFLPKGIDRLFGYHRWYFTVTAFVIYLGLLATLFAVMRRYRFAPCVYAELRRWQFDVCPRCGYWLKGLGSEVPDCPECGAARSGRECETDSS